MDHTALLAKIKNLSPEDRAALAEQVSQHKKFGTSAPWIPNPGPQTDAYYSQADVLLYGGAGGGGKALALDTPLPTPTGWTTMGDVKVGDILFDEMGCECRVTAVTPIMKNRPCHRLVFQDDTAIVADAEHQWPVIRCGTRIPSRPREIKTTQALYDAGAKAHVIPKPQAIRTASIPLPIQPYVFGLWIGSGGLGSCEIENGNDEILNEVRLTGHYAYIDGDTIGVEGIHGCLCDMEVIYNKHIPTKYLRAGVSSRIDLLRGLMDAAGEAHASGKFVFKTKSEAVASGFRELLASLGIPVRGKERVDTRCRNNDIRYSVVFRPALNCFNARKVVIRSARVSHLHTRIKSITMAKSVPVRCIEVDSPSHQYRAGLAMVATHNSDLGIGLAFSEHKRSLILRRRYSDIGALIERAIEMNGSKTGYNGTPPPTLRTVNHRFIQFGANQHPGDEQTFQGRPYDFKCVARGTKVIMGDDTTKNIEDIVAGDMVATLEGPHRVRRAFPVRRAEAVLVRAFSLDGSLLSEQVQSEEHRLLGISGWVSHGSDAEPARPCSFAPTECRDRRTPLEECGTTYEEGRRPLRTKHSGPTHTGATDRPRRGLCGHAVSISASEEELQGSGSAASDERHQDAQRPALSSFRQGLLLQRHQSGIRTAGPCTSSTQGHDGRSPSELECSTDDCSFGCHQCGGHARQRADLCREQAVCQEFLLRQDGAVRPSPTYSEDDGRGKTPTRTRRICTYAHPYTGETRYVDAVSLHCEFETRSVGLCDLYDIEVEVANHYITDGGFVNKNCFDEACHFLESQVHFHLGWLRSSDPNQRCRALLASNPPVDSDGDWLIGMFRPWLDLTHHRPAKPGELRWFVTVEGNTNLEVDDADVFLDTDGHPAALIDGKVLKAQSRSFIPAKLSDNPFLSRTNYAARLDALPEPMRSAIRDGNFMLARKDAEWQVIPTAWIIEAQARWKSDGHRAEKMTAIAMDPAGGGKDAAEIMCRHGFWFSEPVSKIGSSTADGSESAATITRHRRNGADVIIDVGGGYGGAVALRLTDNNIPYMAFNGANSSVAKTVDRQLGFANKRAEAWWRFREALDPDQDGGSIVALPPDPELRSDLAAPTYKVSQRGILIEAKDSLRARLGRSTGKGDATVMCALAGIGIRKSHGKSTSAGLPTFAKRRGGPLTRKRYG